MSPINWRSLIFSIIFALLVTCIIGHTSNAQEITTQQKQEQKEQAPQELKFPEWDGVYLWTADNKFIELKPLKKYRLIPDRTGFFSGGTIPNQYILTATMFRRFGLDEFNIYSNEEIQGFLIKGRDYLECIKFYNVFRSTYIDDYFRFNTTEYYKPSKKKSVGIEAILIKIDDFASEFGFIENSRYLLIVYHCPGTSIFTDAKFWVVGVKKSPSPVSK